MTRATEADLGLCELVLSEHQLVATPRQLQEYRRLGLLMHETISLGRGRGTQASYPPGSSAQVALILQSLAALDTLDRVLLGLFGAARLPRSERADRAVLDAYRRYLSDLEGHVGTLVERFDHGGRSAVPRTVKRATRGVRDQSPKVAERIDAACRTEATGDRRMSDVREAMFVKAAEVVGEGGSAPDLLLAIGADPNAVASSSGVRPVNEALGAVEAVVEQYGFGALVAARDGIRELFAPVMAALFGADPGFDLPLDDPRTGGIFVATMLPSSLAAELHRRAQRPEDWREEAS